MKTTKRAAALILIFLLAQGRTVPALAASEPELINAAGRAAQYVCEAAADPQVGSVGGEWAVLGLARSGHDVPDGYYRGYYAAVEAYVRACGGVLSASKHTEYSRVVLALTAIGKDPADVAGYNLLTPLGDFNGTVRQGVNGPIWALIALDSGGYAMPQNPGATVQATREMYVGEILSHRLSDGGWALSETDGSDPDTTAMALTALSKYTDDAKVAAAVGGAVDLLSGMQNGDGGYAARGTETSESAAQVAIALCELGIGPNDARFVKDGGSLLDNLLSYQQPDGGFTHTGNDGGSNRMASEQGLCALAAVLRAESGQTGLYRMSDAEDVCGDGGSSGEPAGRHEDVKAMPITVPGATFSDIAGLESKTAIEALAERGILNGTGGGIFAPEKTMTRAQFAAAAVRGLGLTARHRGVFTDVPENAWYAAYVDTADGYGIVNGVGNGHFHPEGTITRQEAAVMTARAAKLCGLDTGLTASEVRDTLAQFGDYTAAADWAQASLAFCYREGILDPSALDIEPAKAVSRGEVARMLFNMLALADLI